MSFLADLFHSEVRADVFRVLFGLRPERMYQAELKRLMDFAPRSVEEELEKLLRLQLLVSERDGNRVYYTANREHPLYPEIRNIVMKTVGLRDVLAGALSNPNVEFAFVFGSLAAGSEMAASDVDLMIIGPVTERTVSKLLRGMGERIGREINPHVYTRKEIARRVETNDHFLNDVLSKPKLFVNGNENEFDRLAQRRVDSTP